jgi:hypothetical protein
MFEQLLVGPWSWILRIIAIIHFIRRRPDTYWLWIIIIGGWIGALVYIFMEVIPDFTQGNQFDFFARRRRIAHAEELVVANPSAGNYEELADLYLDDGKLAKAKECYDKAISARTDSPDPFYRRALCEVGMNDFAAAVPDLERVVEKDPKYDFYRAQGLLAHSYSQIGRKEDAERLFENVVNVTTISETWYNYATFLQQQGRKAEAKEWATKILAKKPGMPGYLKRRERPWFRKAASLQKASS